MSSFIWEIRGKEVKMKVIDKRDEQHGKIYKKALGGGGSFNKNRVII